MTLRLAAMRCGSVRLSSPCGTGTPAAARTAPRPGRTEPTWRASTRHAVDPVRRQDPGRAGEVDEHQLGPHDLVRPGRPAARHPVAGDADRPAVVGERVVGHQHQRAVAVQQELRLRPPRRVVLAVGEVERAGDRTARPASTTRSTPLVTVTMRRPSVLTRSGSSTPASCVLVPEYDGGAAAASAPAARAAAAASARRNRPGGRPAAIAPPPKPYGPTAAARPPSSGRRARRRRSRTRPAGSARSAARPGRAAGWASRRPPVQPARSRSAAVPAAKDQRRAVVMPGWTAPPAAAFPRCRGAGAVSSARSPPTACRPAGTARSCCGSR